MFLAKEKALYETLNMMKQQGQSYIGYYWAPLQFQEAINTKMSNQTATKIIAFDAHSIIPPTFFKHTDFTGVFQLIVDTYGIPTYQEANPAVISIVTFPFLFGMMFGDLGHGSILFGLGAFLTMFNGYLQQSSIKFMLPFRYIVLLMGLASSYCGFIYNDWFAMPLQMFDSCYQIDERSQYLNVNTTMVNTTGFYPGDFYYPRLEFNCTYPMGYDPAWRLTADDLTLSNNIKMKLSVIMGIIHMCLGIFIKGTNSVYFRRWPDLIFEVIVGFVILLGLFGWMDFLIYGKWFTKLDLTDRSIRTIDHAGDLSATPPTYNYTTYMYQADYNNQ
jgi:V-type H+-transporting ATPase subunit a